MGRRRVTKIRLDPFNRHGSQWELKAGLYAGVIYKPCPGGRKALTPAGGLGGDV